eukprot:TRINITY_DN12970_c0_g1_i1.p1 TRINITY_DN12970_c0_g1~~TRINITY_DN12970_c0_g1_i1.p1  ORF type:complete len:171 (+),score=31.60 TRINITY_DN12970_c0_g1_i1:37-513(+)
MEFSFVDITNPTNHNEVNVMQSTVGVVISKDSMNKARNAYSKNTTITAIENYTPYTTPTPTPSYTPYAQCYAVEDTYISTSQGKDYAAKGSDKYVYATTEYSTTTGYSSNYSEPREYVNTDDKGGYSKSDKTNEEYAVAVEGKGYSTTYDGPEYVITY